MLKFKIGDRVIVKAKASTFDSISVAGRTGIITDTNFMPLFDSRTRPRYLVKFDHNDDQRLPETLAFRGHELAHYNNPLAKLKKKYNSLE